MEQYEGWAKKEFTQLLVKVLKPRAPVRVVIKLIDFEPLI